MVLVIKAGFLGATYQVENAFANYRAAKAGNQKLQIAPADFSTMFGNKQTEYFKASERGLKDLGWLKSHFFFTFSDWSNPARTAFGTLYTFNDDFVEAGKGFGIHPHVNMEIVSILLKGKMNHIDTLLR